MITKPKGTYDLLGVDAKIYKRIQSVVDAYAKLYNYNFVRTPLFESSDLFKRGVGESTDIVQKETYDFVDRSDRCMTLRPEGTAGVVRSYIENKLYADPTGITKNYYMGTMYRYERPGNGRYREFTQYGVEVLGSNDPMIDAEVIALSVNILRELGIDTVVKINNLGGSVDRAQYKEALIKYLEPHIDELCEDCKTRLYQNPLRILDCKVDDGSEILKGAPNILDYQTEESKNRFKKVLEYLDYLDIDYEVDNTLVRGLDYYDYTVFELKADDGLSVAGGGRYNHMVKELDGPDTPCIGFAAGVERVMNLLRDNYNDDSALDVYVMAVNDEERLKANIILQDLRLNDILADTDYMNKGLKGQFKDADRYKAKQLIILNSEDLSKGLVNIKDNVTKEEHKIPEDEIVDYILGVI